jgi:hypothetical protein
MQQNVLNDDIAQGIMPESYGRITRFAYMRSDIRALKEQLMLDQDFVNRVSFLLRRAACGSRWMNSFPESHDISSSDLAMGSKCTDEDYAAILFTGTTHGHFALLTYTPREDERQITVYDSSYHPACGLHIAFQRQIVKLFGQRGEYLRCNIMKTQQQRDGASCGYFAILFALGLLVGLSPEMVQLADRGTNLARMVSEYTSDLKMPPFKRRIVKPVAKEVIIPPDVYEDVMIHGVFRSRN